MSVCGRQYGVQLSREVLKDNNFYFILCCVTEIMTTGYNLKVEKSWGFNKQICG
jgi:hypothetical protein